MAQVTWKRLINIGSGSITRQTRCISFTLRISDLSDTRRSYCVFYEAESLSFSPLSAATVYISRRRNFYGGHIISAKGGLLWKRAYSQGAKRGLCKPASEGSSGSSKEERLYNNPVYISWTLFTQMIYSPWTLIICILTLLPPRRTGRRRNEHWNVLKYDICVACIK